MPTFTEYSSFLVKGSTVLFFAPFLPLDKRLFLVVVVSPCSHRPQGTRTTHFPTAMFALGSALD